MRSFKKFRDQNAGETLSQTTTDSGSNGSYLDAITEDNVSPVEQQIEDARKRNEKKVIRVPAKDPVKPGEPQKPELKTISTTAKKPDSKPKSKPVKAGFQIAGYNGYFVVLAAMIVFAMVANFQSQN